MPSAELRNILASDLPRGVFWLNTHASVPELTKLARLKGMAFFHLDGSKIEGKDQFMNLASVTMKFPSHFGKNWDAFYDCITDMGWVQAEGYCIYFDHTDAFAEHHESELDTVIELFEDAIAFWKREGQSMLVLLSGKHKPADMKAI